MFESPSNIRKDALNIQTWIHNKLRREGDSNPRYVSVHNLSKIAPSTTRTSLQNAVLMAYTILEKKRFVFSSSEFTTRLHSLSPHRVAHAQNAAHCSRLSHRSFRFKSLRFYKTAIQILKLIWISETKRIWFSLANIVFARSNPPALAFATSCGSCSKRCALLAFIAPLVPFQILALL